MGDVLPWRTIPSPDAIRSAQLFFFASIAIVAMWFVPALVLGRSIETIGLPMLLCSLVILIGTWRRAGERVELHPWGVRNAALWRTRRYPWVDVERIFIAIESPSGHGDKSVAVVHLGRESGSDLAFLDEQLARPDVRVPVVGLLFSEADHRPVLLPLTSNAEVRTFVKAAMVARVVAV